MKPANTLTEWVCEPVAESAVRAAEKELIEEIGSLLIASFGGGRDEPRASSDD